VVKTVTHETVTAAELGGAQIHSQVLPAPTALTRPT